MQNNIPIEKLVTEIQDLYQKDTENSFEKIEAHLAKSLKDIPQEKRMTILNDMIECFRIRSANNGKTAPGVEESERRFAFILLGNKIQTDFSSVTLKEELHCSLETVRKLIKEIITMMNETFPYNSLASDETAPPLAAHLLQIKNGFLIIQKAFQNASRTKMKEMLDTLSPSYIESLLDSRERNEPFHKVELYDIYSEKHETLVKWLNSGVFIEALLTEFKKNCNILLTQKNSEP